MVQRHHWGWLSDGLESPFAPAPEPWMADALCAQVDPELFYPEKGGSTRDAKRVCRACPVIAQCLAIALEHDERFGIWAGTSERERRKLRPSDTQERTTARAQKARQLIAEGYSDVSIAALTGLKRDTVRQYRKRLGREAAAQALEECA